MLHLPRRLGEILGMETSRQKIKVLMSARDEFLGLMIREYLESMPCYSLVEAQGPHHLLSICADPWPSPSVLLLDMEGSSVDGVDMIREVRRRNSTLPILGITDQQPALYENPKLRGLSLIGFIPTPFSALGMYRGINALLKARETMAPFHPCKNGRSVKIGSSQFVSVPQRGAFND